MKPRILDTHPLTDWTHDDLRLLDLWGFGLHTRRDCHSSVGVLMTLRQYLYDYLIEHGWIYDAHEDDGEEGWWNDPFQAVRWTREPWGGWWMDPRNPDEPPTRRYLDFDRAVKEQMMYEDDPEDWGWPW